jgi:hypothetical protein
MSNDRLKQQKSGFFLAVKYDTSIHFASKLPPLTTDYSLFGFCDSCKVHSD